MSAVWVHFVVLSLLISASSALIFDAQPGAAAEPAATTQPAAVCVSTVGPGIPPPSSAPSGLPGFHAFWFGQSGYPTLCPGERSTATVAFYNSGSRGWVAGRMGEMAFLGTSDPTPGHDQISVLGSRSGGMLPATGWAADNRPAAQPADYVGPGQVAWFQFTVQAPLSEGTYLLYIRPVIEGATWMEDFGVFWQVTVKGDAGGIAVTPQAVASVELGATRAYTAAVSGAPGCVDLAFIRADGFDSQGRLPGFDTGRAELSSAAVFASVNGANVGTSYVDCVTLPADQTFAFTVSSNTPNAYVMPMVFRDLDNNNNPLGGGIEPLGYGGSVRFVPAPAAAGARTVTVGVVNTDEDYFVDSAAAATYRYESNDVFRHAGSPIPLSLFEQVLSRGDTIAVVYDPAGISTFDITRNVGHEAPTVSASVDSWDRGPTQNDVALRITEPATNVDFLAYSIQRASVAAGTGCDAASGTYAQIGQAAMDDRTDSRQVVDGNVASGSYCYRVGATDPMTGTTAFGYSERVTITDPPAPTTLPRSLDARVTTNVGSTATIDVGDVLKVAFSEPMRDPTNGLMLTSDGDGSLAELRCIASEQACTLNAEPETLGGVTYPANTVITLTMRTGPRFLRPGPLDLPATVANGAFFDVAGNQWDLPSSTDIVLASPD